MKSVTIDWQELGTFGYSNQCLFCHNTTLIEGTKYCVKYGLPLAVFEVHEYICTSYRGE